MNESPSPKAIAIIAYITFIGTLIAYFMNREERHEFASKHIQNMFGLLILLLCSQVAYKYMGLLLGDILWYSSFAGWAFSLVTAIMEQEPSIPNK